MKDDLFVEFYNKYSKQVWLYIFKLCKNDQQTDEIVQEAFMRIIQASIEELTEYQQKAYLYKTATNLVIDAKRRLKLNERAMKYQINFEKSCSNDFYEVELEQIFQFLNLKEKTILWLAYVEGYNHQEISVMMGFKKSSVKVLLYRTREKVLRKTGLNKKEWMKNAKILFI